MGQCMGAWLWCMGGEGLVVRGWWLGGGGAEYANSLSTHMSQAEIQPSCLQMVKNGNF